MEAQETVAALSKHCECSLVCKYLHTLSFTRREAAALKLGLVDGVVPAAELLGAARALALEIAAGTKPRSFSLYRSA